MIELLRKKISDTMNVVHWQVLHISALHILLFEVLFAYGSVEKPVRLAETIMVPAGHGHEHQGASPAASPGRSVDRDTTTESILASPAPRSEPASRRAPIPADPALTRFPFDGSGMTMRGATRARRLLEDFAWSTRTIGSRRPNGKRT
jgi:hypothetical protein